MHYYNFNIGDYKSHTEHLEPLEDLAYRRMIDWSYLHEKQLPLDTNEIARLIRMRTHSDCIAYVLQTYFERTATGYVNSRIEREIAKYNEKSYKAKKSAEARWKNKGRNDGDSSDANAMQALCERNAKQETRNKKQEPVTNKQLEEQSKLDGFEEWWKIYPKKTDKKKSGSIWKTKLLCNKKDLLIDDIKNRVKLDFIHREKKFIPNPTTFLNGEKWSDEVIKPSQKKDRSNFTETNYAVSAEANGFKDHL